MRIGFVLGGGGLTGMAFHAGVLTALAGHAGIDAREAEVIIGTSAGSTSASLIRAGFPPGDYVNRVLGRRMSPEGERILAGLGPLAQPPARERAELRPGSPELLRRILQRPWAYPVAMTYAAAVPAGTLDVRDISPDYSRLFPTWPQRPMWITAVDHSTGEPVIFGRDATASVTDAVAASCAIPGYFAPVRINGRNYVDGGTHSNHYADELAGLGLDLVIVSAPTATTDKLATDLQNLARVPVRRKLDGEVAKLRKEGTRVVVFAPDRRLRDLMGLNSMVMSRRARVASAVLTHVRGALERGVLDTPLA